MALTSLAGLAGAAIGGGVIGRAVVELVGDSTRLATGPLSDRQRVIFGGAR